MVLDLDEGRLATDAVADARAVERETDLMLRDIHPHGQDGDDGNDPGPRAIHLGKTSSGPPDKGEEKARPVDRVRAYDPSIGRRCVASPTGQTFRPGRSASSSPRLSRARGALDRAADPALREPPCRTASRPAPAL